MTGLFENTQPKATRDALTNKTYPSRSACYRALAISEGMDPRDALHWYALCKEYPGRFEDVATGWKIGRDGRTV